MLVGGLFLILMLLGAPIAIALGVAGLTGMFEMGGARFASLAPSKVFNGLNIFSFLAMPFFILAGEIMNHTGITIPK
jgi:TRAP-type mannitol/chloroaromatic compound transport system permease large subunit